MGRKARVLRALAGDMARQLSCTHAEARQALGELQRAGLVEVRAGRVVLPLAPRSSIAEAVREL